MIAIREFVRTGGAQMSDTELRALVRGRMLMAPLESQRDWLEQVELLLDAYGTAPQREAAERLRGVLRELSANVKDSRAKAS